MTTEQQAMVVLKNEAGEYFALPQDVLERSRVPAGQTAEAARLFETAEAETDDVSGHMGSLAFAFIRYNSTTGGGIGGIFARLAEGF